MKHATKSQKRKAAPNPYTFDVSVGEPAPNKMFSEFQHAITKFLTYSKPVKCAYCGRMRNRHWTQLKFFRIAEGFERKLEDGRVVEVQSSFAMQPGKELFPPLTPVCPKHILAPEMNREKR